MGLDRDHSELQNDQEPAEENEWDGFDSSEALTNDIVTNTY